MRRFPSLPKALLKPPRGFKKPRVADFKADMQRLGEDIAEEFKETLKKNLRTNKYHFTLKEETIRRKGSRKPLIDTGELMDSIYRDKTSVSVEDTKRDDSSLTNKELFIVHEYGVKDLGIPARPLWRNTYRDFKKTAQKDIEDFFQTTKFKRNENNNKRVHTKRKKR